MSTSPLLQSLRLFRYLGDWRSVAQVAREFGVVETTAYRWLTALADAGEAVVLAPPRAVDGARTRYYRARFLVEPETVGLDGSDLALALIDHATSEAELRVALTWAREVAGDDAFLILDGRAAREADPLRDVARLLYAEATGVPWTPRAASA